MVPRDISPRAGRASALGFELVGTVLAGGLIGYFIDRRFSTDPWGLVGGVVAFAAVGLVRLVVEAIRIAQDDDR
ncbi:MAG: AtpZ/AtpI family protein [Deltaproteobacteria bacterium]|nr:AtpZ/AtpI family protein [Deltaproteobacteria bacterium]